MDWEHIGYTKTYFEYYNKYNRKETVWETFPIYVKVINGAIFFAAKHDDDFYIINQEDYFDHYYNRQVKNEYFRVGDRRYFVVDIPYVVGITNITEQSKSLSSK